MKKNRVWRAALQVGSALALVLTVGLAGCDSGDSYDPSPNVVSAYTGSGETVSVDTLANLPASLSRLPARNSADNPHTVILSSSFIIDNNDSSDTGVWATVNSAVKEAYRYVALDLSACSAAGNTVKGSSYSLLNNDMNIIKYNQYITGIVLPNTLTSIGDYAFDSCSSLTNITIPNGVESIGYSAFSACSRLASITIPASVESIGDWAFSSCTGLVSISVDASNSSYSSLDGVLFNATKSKIIVYPQGNSRTNYVIPNSVTSIEGGAFSGCENLTSVTIPAGFTTIDYNIFSNCTALVSISVDASNTSFTSLDGVIFNYAKTKIIAYPRANSRTNYAIPNTVTSIGDTALFSCKAHQRNHTGECCNHR